MPHNNRKTTKKERPCLLGAHFSIAGGLPKALFEAADYGCNVLQIFTKNASNWRERVIDETEIKAFDAARKKTGIKWIAAHTSYLINLASPNEQKHAMSCRALTQELIRASQLDIPYVVMHPGSHMGEGERFGVMRVAESVDGIFTKNPHLRTRLLFETTAGQGTSIGHTFEQLAAIISSLDHRERTGICIDTCHMFAAGYDVRSHGTYQKTVGSLEAAVGLDLIRVIHLNDAKKGLGSRVDRHEHIGEGAIGIKAFSFFMNDKRFADVPKIIETPKKKNGDDGDRINLDRLKALVSDRISPD